MKQYPERDIMFDSPKNITIVRFHGGYDIVGVGIGIKGSQYPGDLREIIPAPYAFKRTDVDGSVVDLEFDFRPLWEIEAEKEELPESVLTWVWKDGLIEFLND